MNGRPLIRIDEGGRRSTPRTHIRRTRIMVVSNVHKLQLIISRTLGRTVNLGARVALSPHRLRDGERNNLLTNSSSMLRCTFNRAIKRIRMVVRVNHVLNPRIRHPAGHLRLHGHCLLTNILSIRAPPTVKPNCGIKPKRVFLQA